MADNDYSQRFATNLLIFLTSHWLDYRSANVFEFATSILLELAVILVPVFRQDIVGKILRLLPYRHDQILLTNSV